MARNTNLLLLCNRNYFNFHTGVPLQKQIKTEHDCTPLFTMLIFTKKELHNKYVTFLRIIKLYYRPHPPFVMLAA